MTCPKSSWLSTPALNHDAFSSNFVFTRHRRFAADTQTQAINSTRVCDALSDPRMSDGDAGKPVSLVVTITYDAVKRAVLETMHDIAFQWSLRQDLTKAGIIYLTDAKMSFLYDGKLQLLWHTTEFDDLVSLVVDAANRMNRGKSFRDECHILDVQVTLSYVTESLSSPDIRMLVSARSPQSSTYSIDSYTPPLLVVSPSFSNACTEVKSPTQNVICAPRLPPSTAMDSEFTPLAGLSAAVFANEHTRASQTSDSISSTPHTTPVLPASSDLSPLAAEASPGLPAKSIQLPASSALDLNSAPALTLLAAAASALAPIELPTAPSLCGTRGNKRKISPNSFATRDELLMEKRQRRSLDELSPNRYPSFVPVPTLNYYTVLSSQLSPALKSTSLIDSTPELEIHSAPTTVPNSACLPLVSELSQNVKPVHKPSPSLRYERVIPTTDAEKHPYFPPAQFRRQSHPEAGTTHSLADGKGPNSRVFPLRVADHLVLPDTTDLSSYRAQLQPSPRRSSYPPLSPFTAPMTTSTRMLQSNKEPDCELPLMPFTLTESTNSSIPAFSLEYSAVSSLYTDSPSSRDEIRIPGRHLRPASSIVLDTEPTSQELRQPIRDFEQEHEEHSWTLLDLSSHSTSLNANETVSLLPASLSYLDPELRSSPPRNLEKWDLLSIGASKDSNSMVRTKIIDLLESLKEFETTLQKLAESENRVHDLTARLAELEERQALSESDTTSKETHPEHSLTTEEWVLRCEDLERVANTAIDAEMIALEMLEDETARRQAAERALDLVRRECTSPFVAPALLDAFVAFVIMVDEAEPMRELAGDSQTELRPS